MISPSLTKSFVVANLFSIASSVSCFEKNGMATVNPNPTGGLGSCGEVFEDSSYSVALGKSWMNGNSTMCGRKIVVLNTGGPAGDQAVGGQCKLIMVTVRDTCTGCDENHLDLSVTAWNTLTHTAYPSKVGIAWHFCDEDGTC